MDIRRSHVFSQQRSLLARRKSRRLERERSFNYSVDRIINIIGYTSCWTLVDQTQEDGVKSLRVFRAARLSGEVTLGVVSSLQVFTARVVLRHNTVGSPR